MAKVIAMYGRPADPVAFNRYYFSKHVPIAKRIPNLRAYEILRGPIGSLEGPAPYHLIAVLTFDSRAAIEAALASDEGKATAADLANFATGGVHIYFGDTDAV
jgi:uncharacterized protein (TIGR02118 family)